MAAKVPYTDAELQNFGNEFWEFDDEEAQRIYRYYPVQQLSLVNALDGSDWQPVSEEKAAEMSAAIASLTAPELTPVEVAAKPTAIKRPAGRKSPWKFVAIVFMVGVGFVALVSIIFGSPKESA